MRPLNLIFILSTLLLVTACGSTKRVIQTDSEPATYRDQKRTILHPRGSENIEIEGVQAGTLKLDKGIKMDRPVIKFSFEESQHVKFDGVNPLPADGLMISLDNLKEQFCYPLKGKLISDYGVRSGAQHTGIDLKATLNDTIRAVLPGVVRMSKEYSGYGNLVVIRHYEGFETLYAHNSKNLVQVNDVVDGGTPIALAGSTGRSTTEHLHFELRADGESVDPNKFIDTERMELKDGPLFIERRTFGFTTQVVAYNTDEEREKIEDEQRFLDPLKQRMDNEDKKIEEEPAQPVNEVKGTKPASATDNTQAEYHTVAQGDTLYGIALKHKTTVAKLCSLNGIKEGAILRLKQKVRVK